MTSVRRGGTVSVRWPAACGGFPRLILVLALVLTAVTMPMAEIPLDSLEIDRFCRNPQYGNVFDWREVEFHVADEDGWNLFLVEFEDLYNSSPYRVIDTIHTCSFLVESGTNGLVFLDRRDSCVYLILITLLPELVRDTVFAFYRDDYFDPAFVRGFAFTRRDSLFAHWDYVEDDEGHTVETTILRLLPSESADTVRVTTGVGWPQFSADGTELFLLAYHQTWDSTIETHIAVYDAELDSLWVPELTSRDAFGAFGAYRANKKMPLYYTVRSGGEANVWKWEESLGEVQVTFVKGSWWLVDWVVYEDSLVYYLGTYGPVAFGRQRQVIKFEDGASHDD